MQNYNLMKLTHKCTLLEPDIIKSKINIISGFPTTNLSSNEKIERERERERKDWTPKAFFK